MALDDFKINLNEVNLVSQLDDQPQMESDMLKQVFDQAGQNIKTKYNNLIDDIKTLIPTGLITPFGGDTVPSGWLLCDGSAVSRTTYAQLFELIGTTYGAGDGETTFNVPNLKGKTLVGKDTSQTEFNTLNKTGGEIVHKLTISEMPSHNHNNSGRAWLSAPSGMSVGEEQGGSIGGTGKYYFHSEDSSHNVYTETMASSGGSGNHNNLQPYTVVNYIIKA